MAAQVGDVLLAQVTVVGGTGVTITPPATSGSWFEVPFAAKTNGTNVRATAYWHVVAAGESTYNFGFSSSQKASGGIVAYDGVDPTNPIATHSSTTSSGTSHTPPAITTTGENQRLVALFGMKTGTTVIPPALMGELWDVASSGGSAASRTTSEAADQDFPTPGSSGTKTATSATSTSVDQLLALR